MILLLLESLLLITKNLGGSSMGLARNMRCLQPLCLNHLFHHIQRWLLYWKAMLNDTSLMSSLHTRWLSTTNAITKLRDITAKHLFNSKGHGFVQGHQSGTKNSIWNQSPSHNQSPNPLHEASKNTKDEIVICQICNKRNHTALKCFNRFNHSFTANNIPQQWQL